MMNSVCNNVDKWKSLLSGLGRPTLRGIRKCPKCQTVNGTRGNSCKNKSCDVVFRDNGHGIKKASTEACRIVIDSTPGYQMFSVRLRDRGPDYRNFVVLPSVTILTGNVHDQVSSGGSLPKCYIEACNRGIKNFPCLHIQAAQRCFSESQPLTIKRSIVPSFNIPSDLQEILSLSVSEYPEMLVHRVSKTSFIVKCNATPKHPLGYLHIIFFKPNKDDGNMEKKFLCACRPFKMTNKDTDNNYNTPDTSYDTSNKMCLHYYACLCAFASNESLAVEFECYLRQSALEFGASLLSQLHLVALPPSSGGRDVETIDPNQISVEIMRENISLLESIAAADDSSLPNVQGLEGVLSDQIIVTNVDDSLSFGDPSGLDSLDETEHPVCQMFANTQNNIQLTGSFQPPTDNTTHPTPRIAPPAKKRKTVPSNRALTNENSSTAVAVVPVTAQQDKAQKRNSPIRLAPATSITYSVNISDRMGFAFDHWLAGVNECINKTMNFKLSGKPSPLVYLIPHEFFECFKERITTGMKKKRLPNQTLIIHRNDRAPIGTFTKHIWKISNIFHVLQIFSCNTIHLKIQQQFIQTANGLFEEWIPPTNPDDSKNLPIVPVLHTTHINVGKVDANSKELVPFILEWIPDLYPESKLGELSIQFQFEHKGPVNTDELKRNSKKLNKKGVTANSAR